MSSSMFRASFAPIAVLAVIVAPSLVPSAWAQEEYVPTHRLNVDPHHTYACVDGIAKAYDRTCGFYGLQPLKPSLTKDPLFCGTECRKCCEVFTAVSPLDFVALNTSCRCFLSTVTTGGLDILGCVGAGGVNVAYSLGLIDEESRLIAITALTALSLVEGGGALAQRVSTLRGQDLHDFLLLHLPEHVLNTYNIEAIAGGISILAGMAASIWGACDSLSEIWDDQLMNLCMETCDHWYPDPGPEPPTPPIGGGGPGEPCCEDPGPDPFPEPPLACGGSVGDICESKGVQGVVNEYCDCESVEVTEGIGCSGPNRRQCELEVCRNGGPCAPWMFMFMETGGVP